MYFIRLMLLERRTHNAGRGDDSSMIVMPTSGEPLTNRIEAS
jgi:hypothetical protein